MLVDFHAAGHHPAFLKLFVEGLGKHLVGVVAPYSKELSCVPKGVEKLEEITVRSVRFRNVKGGNVLAGLERFFRLNRRIRDFEKASGVKISHVVFACLYDIEFHGSKFWGFFLNRWKWSALYLHPIFDTGGEPLLRDWMRHKNLGTLAVLDEDVIDPIEKLSGKRCVKISDTVFTETQESEIRRRIRDLKSERFTVILSGFLSPEKGVKEFLDLVELLDPSRFFFVLVGALHFPDFDPEEQARLLHFSQERENGFACFQRIPDERVLNGILEESNLIFAAYLQWRFSSNAVGKAATFGKPILVTEGEVMGKRVERFRLGATVPEGDVEAMATEVLRYAEDLQESVRSSKAKEYLEANSKEAFRGAVSRMLE